MTVPAWPQQGAPLKPREVTAALRRVYPASVAVRSAASPDGAVLVSLGNPAGRYLGIGRDDRVAGNLLGWYLGRPVKIAGYDYKNAADCCEFSVAPAPAGPPPVDPGSGRAVPAYTTTRQVIGEFPANRVVEGLIRLALDAGCRPHLFPWRSGHGRQYRVGLWHTDSQLLFGCIDAGEDNGRFAAAYLQWGTGTETRHADPKTVRQNLTSCRDLHLGPAAAAVKRSPANVSLPPEFAPLSSVQAPRGGTAPRKRAAQTTTAAQQPSRPRSLP